MEKEKYYIEKHIRYRLYNHSVFLYDLKNRKIYALSEICADILDFCGEGATFEEIVSGLRKRYAVADEKTFRDDVRVFMAGLSQKGIVRREGDRGSKQNESFEKNLLAECFRARTPLNVVIEATYACSERCRHCYAVGCEEPETRKELTTDEIKKLLDDLRRMNVFEITFTGGEFFIRKDAMDILRYATEKGFVIDVFTNGILLTDDMLFELAGLYPRSVHVSLYSPKAEVHDYITQVKGSFKKTVRAAKKLVRLGVPVNIKTVVMRLNSQDMGGLIDLADEIGATLQIGTSISAKNDGDQSPCSLRETDPEKMADVFRKYYERIRYCGDDERARDRESTVCGAGVTSLSVDPYGDVYPCTALKICVGNIRETPIGEIWSKSEALKDWYANRFDRIEGCRDCPKADYCSFCAGTALLEKGSPLVRYDEACFITEAKLKAIKKI